MTSVPPKVRALETILLQLLLLTIHNASLDYELSLSPSTAKLSHPEMAFPKSQDRWQTKEASVLERSKHMFKNPLPQSFLQCFTAIWLKVAIV